MNDNDMPDGCVVAFLLTVLVIVLAAAVAIYVQLTVWNPEDSAFRRACVEAGGTPIVDHHDYGSICIESLIEVTP